MNDNTPKVIIIPAMLESENHIKRQLRAAAYCRVSTDDEEQLTSYEAQQKYYTDKIMTNKEWTMAGVFADEGITGTSARKRPEFLRMIRLCKQGKIDVVLTKSISRFARNTVDCLSYIRALKELGIAVIFEKENINTLETDSEILITMLGAFAQSESESISANVKWGKRQAMREGKAIIQYKKLFGYEKGEDGRPKIIPEQADVVLEIYKQYKLGATFRGIKEYLENHNIPNASGKGTWSYSAVKSILTNEKYCGDVLLQKTFRDDCINRKAIKNTGQLPMYLVQNHHEGIVSRDEYNAVQTEIARRNTGKSPSTKNAPTGRHKYSSKYALSDRLVCGECGTLYQRCTWRNRDGSKRIVWRCVSRVDYGTKYCHNSPTLDEKPLQQAILAAINKVMGEKKTLIYNITSAMEHELMPMQGQTLSLSDIEHRLERLEQEFQSLLEKAAGNADSESFNTDFRAIMEEQSALKAQRQEIMQHQTDNDAIASLMASEVCTLESALPQLTEWDESIIRQLVETVRVESDNEIVVYTKGGIEITQPIIC